MSKTSRPTSTRRFASAHERIASRLRRKSFPCWSATYLRQGSCKGGANSTNEWRSFVLVRLRVPVPFLQPRSCSLGQRNAYYRVPPTAQTLHRWRNQLHRARCVLGRSGECFVERRSSAKMAADCRRKCCVRHEGTELLYRGIPDFITRSS